MEENNNINLDKSKIIKNLKNFKIFNGINLDKSNSLKNLKNFKIFNGLYSITTTFTIMLMFGEILRQLKYKDYDPVLFNWVIFGIFIVYYVGSVVLKRHKLKRENAHKFWQQTYTPFSEGVLLDSYSEYATYADPRYFNPKSWVFVIESLNIIISLFIGILILGRQARKYIVGLLIAQIIVCIIYFATMEMNPFTTLKGAIYAFISFVWILIPLIILIQKRI